MTRIIDAHRERFGVEPICRELQVAPSTYYAARCQKPSARRVRDEALKLRLSRSTTSTSRPTAPGRCGGSSGARTSRSRVAPWSG